MNNDIFENTGMPTSDEARLIIKALGKSGIVSVNFDPRKCTRKLLELGLTMPDGKNDCLIFGRNGQIALYLFVCTHNPYLNTGSSSLFGFSFDIARYRSNPLPGVPGVGEAFLAFAGAVATLEGFDLTKCNLQRERPSRN